MPRRRKRSAKPRPTAPLISEGIKEQYFFLPLTLILAAVAYYVTLCPTVYVGDSGELSAAAYWMGIPHSPGYPLYCIIGWIFAHLPIGDDVAYRLNIMSAVFALGTVLVLYLIIYHFTRTPYLSFSISLSFAFSPIFWSQAVVAEVYSLNTFLTALALYFLCRWIEKRVNYWLYLASFVMGLAVTNHQLSFLLLPTGIYLILLFGKGFRKPKYFWIKLAALYILGILVYLYIPIRAAADPPLNWGDPDTLGSFLQAVFKPMGSQPTHGDRWDHFLHAIYLWTIQFSPFIETNGMKYPIPIIWAFGIWGIYKGLSTGWRMARVFGLFLLLNAVVILFVSHPTKQEMMIVGVYYLPAFLVFAVFMATGLREWLLTFLQAFGEKKRPILLALVILILVLIPINQFIQNRSEVDRSGDYYARDHGTTLLNSCPPDSILIVNWDDIFTLWYLQKVERIRPDVISVLAEFPIDPKVSYWGRWTFDELMESHPEIFEGFDLENAIFRTQEEAINSFVAANLNRERAVLFSFYGLIHNFELFSFHVFPVGPIYEARWGEYTPKDLVEAQQAWKRTLEEFRNIYTYQEHMIEEEDFIIARLSDNLLKCGQLAINFDRNKAEWFLEQEVLGNVNFRATAEWFLQQAIQINNFNFNATFELANLKYEDGNITDAKNLFLDACEIDPGNVQVNLNLGRIYIEIDQYELAVRSLERILAIDPYHPEAIALLERLNDN